MPVEKGHVSHSVRRLIIEGLARSASIAYQAHPRDLRLDLKAPETHTTSQDDLPAETPETIDPSPQPTVTPIWGTVSHPGWSSPSSPTLPSLHFPPVIVELPHLIEAKAVSLATNSPSSLALTTTLIPLAVDILQRPPSQNLRDYIAHLTNLSLINSPSLGSTFITLYERARFSTQQISETQFQSLMAVFAEILRQMRDLDPEILAAQLQANGISSSSSKGTSVSEIDADAASISTADTVEHTPFHTPLPRMSHFMSRSLGSKPSKGSLAGGEGTVRTHKTRARRVVYDDEEESPSFPLDQTSSHSLPLSLRPVRTSSSQRSGVSVIRLAEARGPLDLPYEFVHVGLEGEEEWDAEEGD